MLSTEPTVLTHGDARYVEGDRVEFVVVYVDPATGNTRVVPGAGDILFAHSEPVYLRDPAFAATMQGQYAMHVPPPNTDPVRQHPSSVPTHAYPGQEQYRVYGYDVRLLSPLPWTTLDLPPYYYPRTSITLDNSVADPVTHIFVPVRHVVRQTADWHAAPTMDAMLNRFYRRAPYGYAVLFHQPVPHEEGEANHVDGNELARVNEVLQRIHDGQSAERTRRVVGEVVDFGVDYDGVPKLVCRAQAPTDGRILDHYMFHSPFAEVGYMHANEVLYKLPYYWIHDAYDLVTLGPQTYLSVLRYVLCNTLERFRVKTLKYSSEEPGAFYYGFTEDGVHFAKNGRQVLATEIPSPAVYHEEDETRNTLVNHRWLNMRARLPSDEPFAAVKRGYIIYGRLIVREETGQTTLEWCTPPPGLDLLRVYVATEGRSSIFRKLNMMEIYEKLKDRDGNTTLASRLFEGIMCPEEVPNDAIAYVQKELMWAAE